MQGIFREERIYINMSERVVVITGGGGAIGSALARGFAKQGDFAVIANRSEKTGLAVEREITGLGYKAKFIRLDLSDSRDIVDFFKTVETEIGPVEVLINNAGTNFNADERKPFDSFIEEKHDMIMTVDLYALIGCCRAVLPYMIERGRGNILNISSIAGVTALRNQAAFVGAKAAVIGLTRALAIDYAQYGIHVNCVAPGSVMFEGTKALFYNDPVRAERMLSHIPAGRPGEPEEITGPVLFLTSKDASYITGHTLVADGGWTAGFTRNFSYR